MNYFVKRDNNDLEELTIDNFDKSIQGLLIDKSILKESKNGL